ncbi:MAG: hypothetical protein ABL890_05060 [Candidatus Peribacteraceae bacterium]
MFFRRKDRPRKRRRVVRKLIVGFIIGGAITSIIGKSVIRERRREHLGEGLEE